MSLPSSVFCWLHLLPHVIILVQIIDSLARDILLNDVKPLLVLTEATAEELSFHWPPFGRTCGRQDREGGAILYMALYVCHKAAQLYVSNYCACYTHTNAHTAHTYHTHIPHTCTPSHTHTLTHTPSHTPHTHTHLHNGNPPRLSAH